MHANNEDASAIENLTEDARAYLDTVSELYLLKLVKKISAGVATLFVHGLIAFLIVLIMLLLSIGIAIWINHFFAQPFVGYFIIAAVYAVIVFFMCTGSNLRLRKFISNSVIRNFFSH